MDNGRVSGFDTHEHLLRDNAIYREIYALQTEEGGDFDEPRKKKSKQTKKVKKS